MTRLAHLFNRYFDKTATPEEVAEFMRLADMEEHAQEIRALMEQAWARSEGAGPVFGAARSEAMLTSVMERGPGAEAPGVGAPESRPIQGEAAEPRRAPAEAAELRPILAAAAESAPAPVRRLPWLRIAAAAAILAGLLCGAAWWQAHRPTKGPVLAQKPVVQDVLPGGNKAVLVLNDGSSIALDSTKRGTLATQGKTLVVQTSGGHLAYEAKENTPLVAYNTIRTPRGGQYQVTLADGTKVWLNAASSLRFPTAFNGEDRTVELTGEAYFEVTDNPHQPFRVMANGLKIDVLGTHFDVMAYEDEETINTSLLEGAVKVDGRVLKPGEEARLKKGGALEVGEGDMDQVIAWKNGLFQFESTPLAEVMRQLGRWYDVSARYEGTFSRHFSGQISRDATLEQVLLMLGQAGKAQFSLQQNTVVVRPL